MYANGYYQFITFSIFTIIGLALGIIFDIFRISRKSFKTIDLITHIEDLLFLLITLIILLFSIFKFNNGELRLFLFIGIFTGIIIYFILISKYFIKINVKIILFLKEIFIKITKIIIFPITILIKTIKKVILRPISFVFINFRLFFVKKIKGIKNIVKNAKKASKKEGF